MKQLVRNSFVVRFERKIDRLCAATNRIAEWMVGLAVLTITVVFLWEIFVRFFRIGSLRWALETNRILFITIGFLGSTVAYRRHRHVSFEFLLRKLTSPRQKAALSLLTSISVLLFGVILLREGYASVLTQLNAFLPATGLSRAWLFAPMPVSGVLLVVYSLQRTVRVFLDLNRIQSRPNGTSNG